MNSSSSSQEKTPTTPATVDKQHHHHHKHKHTASPSTIKKSRKKRKTNDTKSSSKTSKHKSHEKKELLKQLKEEFSAYRDKLLEEWMWKKPRGFNKDKWKKRFRPPSYKAFKEKKRIENVEKQLAYEKLHNMIPPNERHVCMEHFIVPDRARFLNVKKLSTELTQHTYLRGLYLSRCIIGNKGLKMLCNALTKTVAPLEILELRSNKITDKGAAIILKVLARGDLNTLKTLGLGYNKLTKKSATLFAELLELNSSNVTPAQKNGRAQTSSRLSLAMDENQMERKAMSRESKTQEERKESKETESKETESKKPAGSDPLTYNSNDIVPPPSLNLQSIDLYHNEGVTPLMKRITIFKGSRGIGSKGTARLAKALKTTHVSLTALNLWSTNMGSSGVIALGEALEVTSCPISTIVLKNNNLKDDGVCTFAQHLEKRCKNTFLKNCSHKCSNRLPLKRLDLSHNALSDDSLIALTQALNVMGPPMNEEDANTRCSRGRPQSRMPLEYLNVSFNRISDNGLVQFAYSLRQFHPLHPLQELDVKNNAIGCLGIKELAWAMGLSKSTNFQHIDVSSNVRIGDEGATCLATALVDTSLLLNTLALNNVGMTEVGATCISEALRRSTAPLECVSIKGNRITNHLQGFVKDWVLFRHAQCRCGMLTCVCVEEEEEEEMIHYADGNRVFVAGKEEDREVGEEDGEEKSQRWRHK